MDLWVDVFVDVCLVYGDHPETISQHCYNVQTIGVGL